MKRLSNCGSVEQFWAWARENAERAWQQEIEDGIDLDAFTGETRALAFLMYERGFVRGIEHAVKHPETLR